MPIPIMTIAAMQGKVFFSEGRVLGERRGRCYAPAMVRCIRKALYCLLFIALPLQGFASSGMHHCVAAQMPLSDSAAMSATPDDDSALLAPQDARTNVGTAIDACSGPAQGTHTSDRSASHCAAYAGCGVVASSVPMLPSVMQVPRDGFPAVPPADPSVGFMTGAPERPPRTAA